MKKKEKILCLVLVCFMIIAVSISLVFIIRAFMKTASDSEKTYKAHQENFVEYDDAFNQKEFVYYLLFISEDCRTCISIETQVCDYIDNYKEGSTYKIYLIDVDKYRDKLISFGEDGEPISNLYVENITDLRIYGTPTMLMIQDKIVVSAQIGAKAVSQQLSSR